MQNRVSLYPGRVQLIPVSGQENTYDMVRADSPTQEGTPLHKDTFLKDATAALFGLGADAVPDEVLALLKTLVDDVQASADSKAKIETGSYVGTGTYGADKPNTLTFDINPQIIFVACSTGSFFVAIRGQNQSSTNYGASYYNVVLTWGEQDITWYNTKNAGNQLNNSNITYYYAAIGT